jgi:hypothetical protein
VADRQVELVAVAAGLVALVVVAEAAVEEEAVAELQRHSL